MTVRDASVGGVRTAIERGGVFPQRHAALGAEVKVVHEAVPGRLRLSVPALKRNPDLARQYEKVAAAWRGVRDASANATTGSLLLEYDPAATSAQALTAEAQAQVDRMTRESALTEPTNLVRRSSGSAALDRPAEAALARQSRLSRQPSQPIQRDLDAEPPVPPLPGPRTRGVEAVLGGAAVLAAGAALWAVRSHGHNLALDQAPLAIAEEIHNPALTTLMRGASGLVEPAVLWPVTIAATLMGVGRRTPGDVPWLAPTAVLGGGAVVTLLKTVLRRGRPTAFEHLVPTQGFSLPSGHAFLAVSLYGLLAHHALRWLRARRPEDRKAAAVLLVAAATAVVMVGASRVYLGVHYPTDVIAGYALALLWLFFLAAINDRPRPAQLA